MKNGILQRRKFFNEWDEIGHRYHQLLYWLYRRCDPKKARPYAQRLERLLSTADPNHEAIFGEECRSLISEVNGDVRNAVRHRKNEIKLIRKLQSIARNKPYQHIALKNYGQHDLSDRLNLLATLYHDAGNLEYAIRTLEESKQLCADHGIAFDAADVLDEYLAERASALRQR